MTPRHNHQLDSLCLITRYELEKREAIGQAGLDFMGRLCVCQRGGMHEPSVHEWEREAVEAYAARLRGAVEALPDQWGPSDEAGYIRQRDVLALIEREKP